jgi:redox-sensitive bicupin YhaK (pirin superfamily)
MPMSTTDPGRIADPLKDAPPALQPVAQRIVSHAADLGGGLVVRRALPTRQRRLIGAWCFLDHIGPASIRSGAGLRVPPHPHIGLQTFTWLIEGEILHRDSLGSLQLIRPGQVNLMTAGRGISHSEETPAGHSSRLHGAQLWIALPEQQRRCAPAFDHYPALPTLFRGGFTVTVLAGEALGERAPTRVHSDMVGLDLVAAGGGALDLPLRADYEYGVMSLDGSLRVDGEPLAPGELLYVGCGRERLALRAEAPARVLLLGGLPFGEPVLMWWNFVARSRAEVAAATEDWNAGRGYFGTVQGYDGAPLRAPAAPWPAEPAS